MPLRDESFDFVWSAGVIHHTSDMDLAISEFRRILRPGGRLFLLVYGTGGLRWKAVKSLRPIVRDLGQEFVDRAIKGAKLPANNRKHWLDDLFVSIQTLTSFYDLQSMLLSNRFSSIQRWVGNTFDHESSVESLLLDLEKLFAICQRAVVIARPGIESVLSNISIKIAGAYLDLARDVLSDQQLSAQQKRQIVIGEGNLRVIASAA